MSNVLSALLALGGMVYVDGYGNVDGAIVGICLLEVRANHVDELHDERWEQFTDCVTWRQGK